MTQVGVPNPLTGPASMYDPPSIRERQMPASPTPRDHYTTVAIWLHWLIAALILANIALGFGHDLVERTTSRQMMWWHQSFGLTVLILTLVRIGWRIGHPVPPMPGHMPGWQKLIARFTHWAFYALMLGLPLTGWAMLSASVRNRPIPFYGLDFPKLPYLTDMAIDARKALSHQFGEVHEVLAWVAIALVILHVAAALKHHFWNKDVVLGHMIPAFRPGVDARLNADAAEPGRDA